VFHNPLWNFYIYILLFLVVVHGVAGTTIVGGGGRILGLSLFLCMGLNK
jgi:hypothetical protein